MTITTTAGADLHADIDVSAHWDNPSQITLQIRITGKDSPHDVRRWVADPAFKAEFLGGAGINDVTAHGNRGKGQAASPVTGPAWVESPALEPGETETLAFTINVTELAEDLVGRLVVTQRDPADPSEGLSWALSADFDLSVAAGDATASTDERALVVSEPSYSLTMAFCEDVDDDGDPHEIWLYESAVRLVEEATDGCRHEPCFGEEIHGGE